MTTTTTDVDVISSTVDIRSPRKSEVLCFQDPRFASDRVTDDVFHLFYSTTRAARAGTLTTLILIGSLFDDASKLSADNVRLIAHMISSFRSVSFCRTTFTHDQYQTIFTALTSSTYTSRIHVEQVYLETHLRDSIKTSSGTIGVLNGYNFLYKISQLLSDRVPPDLWNSGWVFQEAQRMIMYVVQNTFATPMPAEVGMNMFVYACAFILNTHDSFDLDTVLRLATERSLSAQDPCTNLIVCATHTPAGFMPGPTQSTFGLHMVPGEYPLFHRLVLRPDVYQTFDTRPFEQVRTWAEVSALPFLFARMCSTKSVSTLNVDDLLNWSLTIF